MWIVRYALDHRYSVGVLVIVILLFGLLSARRMSTDILPQVDIPAVTVIWTYSGLNAREMATKITSFSEVSILNNVDDVRDVRAETLSGASIISVDFQPYVDVELAIAQVTAISQTILRRLPPGATPPIIVRYSQSSVPIVQLALSSDTLDDAQIFDFARLQLRGHIQTIPGVRMTLPYGGAQRQVMIDLDPAAMQAHALAPSDVIRAVNAQNLTLPSGVLREGGRELQVTVNASPTQVEAFEGLPLRTVDDRVILLRDVANVRDGAAIQTNIARLDGNNAVIVQLLKLGNASTVDIVDALLERLPQIRAAAPPGMTIEPLFDQSQFVRAAVGGVVKEGVVVALLVATVVLLFLGSWRSTLIVLTSIPLALLASVCGLLASGHSFNLMTLGGLALAIGLLVDNALVEIENINRNAAAGLPLREAILSSARQVVFAEFVSTTCICIVFTPMFLLSGVARYIFAPLALAVIFALIASFILSRTLVPTLAYLMLTPDIGHRATAAASGRGLSRLHAALEHGLAALQAGYRRLLDRLLPRFWPVSAAALLILLLGLAAAMNLGREFFPGTDAGLIRLYLRAPPGTRLEDTARLFADVQREIRSIIPADELAGIAENLGAPDPINLAWVTSPVIGSFDGELLIQLAPEHAPAAHYLSEIRQRMATRFPSITLHALAADATAQTLSGRSPSLLDIRLLGRDVAGNLVLARALMARLREIPGVVDVIQRQVPNLPGYFLRIDRVRALRLGVSQRDVGDALLGLLGSAGTVSPSYWADDAAGSSYTVQVQAPPARLSGIEDLLNIRVRGSSGATVSLRTIATVEARRMPALISRSTLAPTINVLANVVGRDLGAVNDDVERVLGALRARQKPDNRIEVTGQARLMAEAYAELAGGLAIAAVLVFLVLAVNFQSWRLPVLTLGGLPFALSGAVFALWLTGTPVSVPALMGVIMVVGVSTANSVLVGSFARDCLAAGQSSVAAATEAATTRLRPVLMTALAMVVGTLPMALGLGEGGEQNAPLGRAVVGGLLLGTVATLLIVPLLYARFAGRGTVARHDEAQVMQLAQDHP